MKRLLATAFAATIAASGALAADIAPIVIPPPPMPVVVPMNDPGSMYISLFGGMALTRNAIWYQPDPEMLLQLRGFRLAGAIGRTIGGGPLSIEGDITWSRLSPTVVCFDPDDCVDADELQLEGTNATLLTLMGNVRIGPNHGAFRPYVAFGGGAARLSIISAPGDFGIDGVGPGNVDNNSWTWGLQAMVGVDFAITDNFLIGARYRFQHIGPTNFIDAGDTAFAVGPLNVHSIEGGITIRFGG